MSDSSRQEAKSRADGYSKLKEYNTNYQGAKGTAEYNAGRDKIMADSGLSNLQYQQMKKADSKKQYEQTLQDRADRAESHYASTRHNKEMHQRFGSGGLGRDSTKDFYNKMDAKNARRTNESYKYDKVNDSHVRALMDSGKDFNELEVIRSKDGGKYQDPSRDPQYGGDIYKEYGGGHKGYKNWKENFSIYGSGGFQGVQDMMSTEDVNKARAQRQSDIDAWKGSDEYKAKWGKYGWSG